MEFKLRFMKDHFEAELWLLPLLCDKNKISVDVGAHMGNYSYYMARFCRAVISFEPNDGHWTILRRLLGSDLHLEKVALSEKVGSATLRIDTGTATIENKNLLQSVANRKVVVQTRDVTTRTLDSFGFSDVLVIKIDVEGHEEAVISGALETIRRNWPVLIIETENRHNAGAPQRLERTLAALGYHACYVKDRDVLPFNTLRAEDTDPRNIGSSERHCINNFLFLPPSIGLPFGKDTASVVARGTAHGSFRASLSRGNPCSTDGWIASGLAGWSMVQRGLEQVGGR
ncbi:MAG: FkbM family methyltransferase [Formivibrio sp.]|nr:FkbM family methyltransferase [Formivibrio sp.]